MREIFPNLQPSLVSFADGRTWSEESAFVEVVRGWMDCIGPTTADALAARLGVAVSRVEAALSRLEADGVVLRGCFTPGSRLATSGSPPEFCERGLLSRIHRLTLGRLRKEIEAVSTADFVRFLFHWQHVAKGTRLHGREGIRKVVEQLQGLELPGPAWERDVLPARIEDYDPADLEQLCLAGEIAWGRLAVTVGDEEDATAARARRRQAPTRAAPLAFVLRESLPELLEPLPDGAWRGQLTPVAADVLSYLEQRGASFLADVARGLRRLPTEVEDALWELVASGLVTGDGIAGLRTLLLPEEKRQQRPRKQPSHLRSLPGRGSRRMMPVGRWSLLRTEDVGPRDATGWIERSARRLLARYGVVTRELCLRERRMPPWRQLLHHYRRMEARGEVRGGRFVAGLVGEQFALPEAVEALRALRRKKEPGETLLIGAADPLNLTGILDPGARVPRGSGLVIAYRDGVPVEVGELGKVLSRLRAARQG